MNEDSKIPTLVAITPISMLAQALSTGAPMELVRELLVLKREYDADEARKAFNTAMANAWGEMTTVLKNKLVDFTSAKGRTRYLYEGLDDVLDAVRPALAKHGLSIHWHLDEADGQMIVTCHVEHQDGHARTNTLSAPRDESGQKNLIQSKGSTITFLQRYTLKAALGLAASLDDDGRASGATPGAPASSERISAEQVAALMALASDIADKGVLDRMKQQLGITELAEIPASKFEAVMKKLRVTKLAEEKKP